jgi:hypothetical protein
MTASEAPIRYKHYANLVVNRDFEELLAAAGLTSFDAFYHFAGKYTVKKEMTARSVIWFELPRGEGQQTFYLKRHQPESIGPLTWLRQRFWGQKISQGEMEFDRLCDFRRRGLATVTPVAAGTQRVGFFRWQSFLMTVDFAPFRQLEKVLAHNPEVYQGKMGQKRKELLLKKVAQVARQMHAAGYNHRDFNATHILMHYPDQNQAPHLALFDLQRIDTNRFFKWRWMIKALAEVSYTLPEALFDDRDRLYLFWAYTGWQTLNLKNRWQWRWIRKKTARISKHTDKIIKRREIRRQRGLPER